MFAQSSGSLECCKYCGPHYIAKRVAKLFMCNFPTRAAIANKQFELLVLVGFAMKYV